MDEKGIIEMINEMTSVELQQLHDIFLRAILKELLEYIIECEIRVAPEKIESILDNFLTMKFEERAIAQGVYE